MIKIDCEKYESEFSLLAAAACNVLKLKGSALAEAELVSKEEIRTLNRDFRRLDAPTDVLSFPALEKVAPFTKANYPADYDASVRAVRIGSIVICEEIAREQGQEYGHGFERELRYLFVHGLLHLLGFDHEEEQDKQVMRTMEEKIIGEAKA